MKSLFKRISITITVFEIFFSISSSNAQPDPPLAVAALSDTSSIALQEVVISENRLQIPFAQQNRNIQIIDRKQIDALPARSLNELLSYVTGVDLRQRGPFGTQADVSIDG